MEALWRGLVDLVLPRACARCGRALGGARALCPPCAAALPRLPPGGCPRCQGPVPVPGALCPGCAAEPSPLEACVAEVAYQGEAADWIHRFKYPRPGLTGLDPRPVALTADLLQDAWLRLPSPRPALLVPVPCHGRRLRQRGFHPAGELARLLGRELGLRVAGSALLQERETESQTGLDRRARRRNLAGAFRAGAAIGHGPLALVDDVVTTGSTLTEAARALRAVGVRRVVAVCVARTPAALG